MYDGIETNYFNLSSSKDKFRSYLDQDSDDADIEVRNNKIMSAKIAGTYVDHLQCIIKSSVHNNNNLEMSVIFLDSYNGVEHRSRVRDKGSVWIYSLVNMFLLTRKNIYIQCC